MVTKQVLPDDFVKLTEPPTRDNLDPKNPYHAYLWGLTQLPWMFPANYLQFVSHRLFDLYGPPSQDWVPPAKASTRKPAAFSTFPTRANCDPTLPDQAYLWGLVALPYQRGAPLIFGVEKLQAFSQRLFDLFGPPSQDWVPRLEYRMPAPSDPDLLTSAGKWVQV